MLMKMYHLIRKILKHLVVVLLNCINQLIVYLPENGYLLVITIQASCSKRYGQISIKLLIALKMFSFLLMILTIY